MSPRVRVHNNTREHNFERDSKDEFDASGLLIFKVFAESGPRRGIIVLFNIINKK